MAAEDRRNAAKARPLVWAFPRVLVAASLVALCAVIIRAIYATAVGPRDIEWFEASHAAQRIAVAHFGRDGDPAQGLLFVLRHHEECFPTAPAWIKARFFRSPEAVATEARESYMQCLGALAEVEKRQRGWRPPRGGEVRGPQNNQMQLTALAQAMGRRS